MEWLYISEDKWKVFKYEEIKYILEELHKT